MSDDDALDLVVPASLDGVRIDRAISTLTGLSRSVATALVESGAARLDGRVVLKGSVALVEGQQLDVVLPPVDDGSVEPDPNVEVNVVTEDVDFVVVDKAAGVVVHPGAGQRHHTLVAGLLARYPEIARLVEDGLCDPVRPGIVHRLDKGTSGLLAVARTPAGFHALSAQLEDRSMHRTYLALVDGHVDEERGVVDAPIGRSSRTPTLMVVRDDGRAARTGYSVLERLDAPRCTLLVVTLETGRTHQIRVHLAAIGHPVVNDTRYGHRRDRRLEEERLFLHAARLEFHDVRGGAVSAVSALPDDLVAALGHRVELGDLSRGENR